MKINLLERLGLLPNGASSVTPATMTLSTTLILLAASLALTLLAGWRGAQPPDPRKEPRMIPWRFIMLAAAALALLLLIHLTTLFGAERAPWV